MAGLQAERGGHRRKARVERHQLHLDAAFLLLVGEGLAHAVGGRIGGVGEADLVVLVIGGADPEPDRVDAAASGRYSPLAVILVWRASMRVLCRRRRCRGCDRACCSA